CPCWEGFREQLDAFLRQFRLPVEQSRDATAGPRQARYVAARDRVIIVGEDDDWNAGARRDCGLQRQFGAARHNDRYVRARHPSRIGESLVRTLVGAAIVDDEVAALGEPELLQFGDKGPISQSTGDGVVEPGVEHADTGDLRGRLLRPRRERPRRRRADKRDECASLQLIELHSVPADKPDGQDIELGWISQRYSDSTRAACWPTSPRLARCNGHY